MRTICAAKYKVRTNIDLCDESSGGNFKSADTGLMASHSHTRAMSDTRLSRMSVLRSHQSMSIL